MLGTCLSSVIHGFPRSRYKQQDFYHKYRSRRFWIEVFLFAPRTLERMIDMMRRPPIHGFGGFHRGMGRHLGRHMHMHMPPPPMPPHMHRPFLPHGGCCGCGGCLMSIVGVGVFMLMMMAYMFY